MKTLLLVLTLFSSISFAADPANIEANPKKQEMMQKWMAYATPAEPHKKLAELAGNWNYTSKMWESAKAKPEESKGTSSMEMVLGGRYLQQKFTGQAMGQPFEGLGFIGYNNLENKYENLWLDNMGTGMMFGKDGTYNEKSKTYVDKGEHSCPMSADKKRDYRTEWKIMDKNTMKFTMWGPGIEDTKEFRQMEITYKRVK